MIYFLINNDYHLVMDLKLTKQLTNYNLGLIQVPYSLNPVSTSNQFSKIYNFQEKLVPSFSNIIIHPSRILQILKNVDKVLKPETNDILLVHTDMDFLNQYIIQKFYRTKAKIYLLEDGTATMCNYNTIPDKATFKHKMREFLLKYFYSFKYTEIRKYGVETLPVMKEFVFNGVIANFGNSIMRKIPFYKLQPTYEPIKILNKSGAIFFSQPQYLWLCSETEYVDYLGSILYTSKNFTPFYFKFHPSDSNSVKLAVIKLINEKYRNINIISENEIAEILIDKYPVQYAITINSTAALNLINKGIIPIFLNNLFNNSFPNSSSIAFGQFLKSIDCKSPATLSDIKPGFCAFPYGTKSENTKSLENVLNLQND